MDKVTEILALLVIMTEFYIGKKYRSFQPEMPHSKRIFDKFYFYIYGTAVFLSFFISISLNKSLSLGKIDNNIAIIIGISMVIVGYGLRFYSIWYLKDNFSVILRVNSDQKLISSGPYKYLRHPSYTGSIIALVGIGAISGYPLVIIMLLLFSLYITSIRIKHEEELLSKNIDGYGEYCKSTKKIIPFIY